MLLKIDDIDSWKNFFDLIHDSTTSVELKLDKEKCSISLLNNSHVCFYTIEYAKEFFEEYYIDETEFVFVDVNDFYSILKSATKKDKLELSTNDNMIKIVLEHDWNRRVFEIPFAEDYNNSPQPPSIEYDGEFTVLLSDLKQPCMDLDKIIKTDKFKMNINNGVLTISSPLDSMTQYNQFIDVNSSLKANSTVNLNYILELQKLNKINNTVTFKINDDLPVSWNITSADGYVNVSGLIAPILEEEDE